MISALKYKNWLPIKIFVLLSIVVPLTITTYELTFQGRESLVFLGDYSPTVGFILLLYYILLLISGFIWLIVQVKSVIRLKDEKARNELLHLQSQVNPHFFFNMLNNLYGMVDKDTEKAKGLILKLSELMRYSIYEGEKKLVSLREEADYLRNYINVHKMRYHKSIEIRFHRDLEDENVLIRPLMFIILLENAFKHGVENLRENAFVHLSLTSKDGVVNFGIINNFDVDELPKERGIGTKNLKRRLELAYPQRHKLVLKTENSIFKAFLQLKHD